MTKVTSTAGSSPIELNVNDTGGDGRTVLLIHGWPLSAEAWLPQIGALVEAGYRVISYDRRGFGASDKPADGYDYDTLAGDTKAVVDALDLDQLTLVGFSMGGGEVARYVGRYGTKKISGTVFASAVPPYLLKTGDNPDGGLNPEDVAGMKGGLESDREGFYTQFARNFYTADGELKVDESEIERWRSLAAAGSTTAALACIDSFGTTDFREDLGKIDVPTLVIHGGADAIVPFEVSGKRTHQTVANSELVILDDGPHGITASHTQQFNSALLAFLRAI